MKLLCCMVTHNRLEYTKQAVEAFDESQPPANDENGWRAPLIIVDNASTDGTREWLGSDDTSGVKVLNRRNLFPGAAVNIGWHRALRLWPDTTHLMRLDNDMQLLPGWREEVERCFDRVGNLGMLGIHNRHEDWTGNPPVELDETGTVNIHWDQVGGNCVIPRRFWDDGLRWTCGAWAPGGKDEDSRFAAEIRHRKFIVGTVVPVLANNLSFHRYEDYPDYYQRTAKLRGLIPELSV